MVSTHYQTEIQYPSAIRWGSAKIEILDVLTQKEVNVGAIKNITATVTTTGEQRFEPDNAPPIIRDPIPKTWDWTFELQEGWNPKVLKLLRGDIDTYTYDEKTMETTIGVYAGAGTRPKNQITITNTTPGEPEFIIVLKSAKCVSDFDLTYPTDADGTVPITLPVKLIAELVGTQGFGTIKSPCHVPINETKEESKK